MSDPGARRDWRLYSAAVFLFTFGFAVYNGPFQKFLRDTVGARELDLGALESLREFPGLLAALTAGTLVALAESRVAALGLAVTALGIGATGLFRTLPSQIAISVFWSVGFHLWVTVQSAITLNLARGSEGGRHLGRMSSIGAVAGIAGLGTVWLMSELLPPMYTAYFLLGGVAILGSAICVGSLSHRAEGGARQRLVLRREYALYYLLVFLEGCRRQIFSIFASFALILVYKVPLDRMLLLQLVNAVLIAVTAPWMGRLVDRVGQKGPLTAYAIGLIGVFLGYATSRDVGVLMLLFLLDNVLFTFGVGFTTYLHRIVRPGELTPSLAMGTTMNHVAAVSVPFLGAWLWHRTGDYQAPFLVGTGIAVVSLIATRWLPEGRTPEPSGA